MNIRFCEYFLRDLHDLLVEGGVAGERDGQKCNEAKKTQDTTCHPPEVLLWNNIERMIYSKILYWMIRRR